MCPLPRESPSSSKKCIVDEVLNLILKQLKEYVFSTRRTLQYFSPLVSPIHSSSNVHIGVRLSTHLLVPSPLSFPTMDPTSVTQLTLPDTLNFDVIFPSTTQKISPHRHSQIVDLTDE